MNSIDHVCRPNRGTDIKYSWIIYDLLITYCLWKEKPFSLDKKGNTTNWYFLVIYDSSSKADNTSKSIL